MGKNKKKGTSKKTWVVDCRTDSAFDFALKVLDEAKREKKYHIGLRCNFVKIAYENSKEAIAKAQTDPVEYRLRTAMKLFNRNLRKIFGYAKELSPIVMGFQNNKDGSFIENPYSEKEIPNPFNVVDIEYDLLNNFILHGPKGNTLADEGSFDNFKKAVYHEYQYPSIIEVQEFVRDATASLTNYSVFIQDYIVQHDKYSNIDSKSESIEYAELLPTNQIKIHIPYEVARIFNYVKNEVNIADYYERKKSAFKVAMNNIYGVTPKNTATAEAIKSAGLLTSYFNALKPPKYIGSIKESIDKIINWSEPVLINTKYYHLYPVTKLLEAAANNPNDVESIYITLYRIGKNSTIIDSLITASKNKIPCKIFFEISARGEIENDLKHIYKMLIEADMDYLDIKLKYSDVKVHGKMILIKTKIPYDDDNKSLFNIGIFSTGNFNEDTAPIYKDYHYITSRPDEVEMIERNFDILWNSSQPILSSISSIIIKEIYTEIEKGKDGRIWIQTNHLDNKYMVSLLKTAIAKGVDVKLIVRTTKGFHKKELKNCKTVVGQYLEHSRVYIFGVKEPRIYISSSDMLFRNLYNRFEVYIKIPSIDTTTKTTLINDFNRLWDGKQ